MMFIYITSNKVNGKRYIGLCTREDETYLGSGKLLHQAIKKYGRSNFSREIIENCDTFETLLLQEEYWIKKYDAVKSKEFYNLADGGSAGNSECLKKYWSAMTPDERKTARNWNGKWCREKYDGYSTDKWIKSVSVGVKKSWCNYSIEEREVRRQNIAYANRYKRNTPKGAAHSNSKHVRVIDELGEHIYISLVEYSNDRGIPHSTAKSLYRQFKKNPNYKAKPNSKWKNIKGIYEII